MVTMHHTIPGYDRAAVHGHAKDIPVGVSEAASQWALSLPSLDVCSF